MPNNRSFKCCNEFNRKSPIIDGEGFDIDKRCVPAIIDDFLIEH